MMDATVPAVQLVPILGCRHDGASAWRQARPASLVPMAVEGAESGLMSTMGAARSPCCCQAEAWLLVECTSDRDLPEMALIDHPAPEEGECYVRTGKARQLGRRVSSGATDVIR